MRRKAGDIIREALRETKLAENRANPIGAGSYGVVYESDIPGNVIKQSTKARGDAAEALMNEINMQSIAADMGLAPRVESVETFRGGIGDRFEMQDVRRNFEQAPESRATDVGVAKQQGQLALAGVRLEDRNPGNVYRNKMAPNQLRQIDFGISGPVSGVDQIQALTEATAEGFSAAGISDVGDIFRATVYDLLEGGDDIAAMDVAKQGFSRLQKIRPDLLV